MARTIAKDHAEKRGLILEAAAKTFAEQGYDRASVSQIAAACSISKANIYHYYSSKGDILFAVLETHLRALRDRVHGLALDGMPPPERLRVTIAEFLLAYDGADDEHKVQAMALDLLPADQQRILKGYQREMVAFLSAIVRDIAPGAFDADRKTLHAVTMSIFGMLNWFYMWNGQADEAARIAYADLTARLALGGIRGL